MGRFNYLMIITIAVATMFGGNVAEARKKGYKLTAEKPSRTQSDQEQMSRGSFMVASQCEDCNNGYNIGQIAFSGFDKPQQSSAETFFITNNTNRTMSGVNLYIEYRDEEGRQLHKRFVRLICNIPPGETRMAEITSWDKQKSFYYEQSANSKRGGTPFSVIFDPVAYYLRF